MHTREELERLTKEDLQELLKAKELPVSGTKAELIDRLLEAEARTEPEDESAPESKDDETTPEPEPEPDPEPEPEPGPAPERNPEPEPEPEKRFYLASFMSSTLFGPYRDWLPLVLDPYQMYTVQEVWDILDYYLHLEV